MSQSTSPPPPRSRGRGKGDADWNHVDIVMGQRLRARRRALGMSQKALGEALGFTPQQVQKYENGTNRIAVVTLVRAAEALGMPLSIFLEGFDTGTTATTDEALHYLVADPLDRIEDKTVRAAVRTLVRALASSG